MRLAETGDQWWKNAVVYCLDVETYLDSDGDGVGDFAGLIDADRLPRRPRRDVPVADAVPPDAEPRRRLRRLRLLRGRPAARHARRLRRVRAHRERPRHPRDRRPRRQPHVRRAPVVPAARADPDGPRRDWYVWRDEPSDEPKGLLFPDKETSNWAYDRKAGPVLPAPLLPLPAGPRTSANPAVRDEIARIMGFWLAARRRRLPHGRGAVLLETAGMPERVEQDPQDWLRSLRSFAAAGAATRCCSARSTSACEDLASYFGDARRRAAHAVRRSCSTSTCGCARARRGRAARDDPARAAAGPARQRVVDVPAQPRRALARQATGPQRDEVFAAFGPDEGMRLYGHGIRRRAAPMLGGDARPPAHGVEPDVLAARHAGVALRRRDRDGGEPRGSTAAWPCACRCSGPTERNGGFSTAAARDLVRPLAGGAFGPAAGQRRRPAPRPGLAAELDGAPDPPPPRDARVRLGHGDADRDRRRRRCSPIASSGRAATVVAVHNLADGPRRRPTRPRRGAAASTTCSSCASTGCARAGA